MIDTEGYVLMDYDGKAVSIEDDTMYYCDADDGQHWDSETLQFEDDEDEEEENDSDEYVACGYVGGWFARLYGMGWYDCN